MKYYEEPKLSVVMFNANDIICTSGCGNLEENGLVEDCLADGCNSDGN
ncbi:MAG: hypothetical protein IKN81_05050 [Oscillospiraceae bacterium]|nr:hypothetical protein [Oscillospiraceae bacterium]